MRASRGSPKAAAAQEWWFRRRSGRSPTRYAAPSVRALVGAAPVLAGTKVVVAAVVAPKAARGLVVGRHEAVPIAHAAIMRRLDPVPDDEAIGVHAAIVDAHGLDAAAHHQPVAPFARPLHAA